MTWEAVARQRLNDVLDAEQATSYQNAPLTVSLFQTAEHRPSDRVGAAISDPVGAGFSLGYAFAVLNFSAPVVGCVRPPMVELSQLDAWTWAARRATTSAQTATGSGWMW